MAKGIYVGVDSKARKVKKAYVGVDSKARKVKKGYIGVGGIARLFFASEPELSYYGKADNLSLSRQTPAVANVGNYVVFAGGDRGSSRYATVDAYSTSLTISTPAE